MPTPQQIDSLQALLDTRSPITLIETHDEQRVLPLFGELIARIGLEDARELWSLSKEGAEYVRANATEAQMPGIALSEGALEVSNV